MRNLTLVLLTAVVALGCGKKPEAVIDTSPAPNDRPRFPPKPANAPEQTTETDEQKAQGVWKLVAVELPPDDPAPPPEALTGLRFQVKDNLLTVSKDSKRQESFTFKSDATASPKTVDFTDCDEKGVPSEERFRADVRGIYKFEGDEIVFALAVEGSKSGYRPTEFKAALTKGEESKKQHHMVTVLRLKKADPNEPVVPSVRPKPRKTPSTGK